MHGHEYWVNIATRLSTPVLTNLANRTLRAQMPVEQRPGESRGQWTHLEAFGRLLAGIARWLELGEDCSRHFAEPACDGLDAATDPASPDFMNFSTGRLYLCSVGLLPLGLPASDPFWSEPPALWTAAKAWSGKDFPIDHALR